MSMPKNPQENSPEASENLDDLEISNERLVAPRLEQRKKLLELGDPYPARVNRSHTVAAAREYLIEEAENTGDMEGISQEVSIVGRIIGVRRAGGMIFADLRDYSGEIQIQFRTDALVDFDQLNLVAPGDFLQIRGNLFRTRRGEITVSCEEWSVVTKAVRPFPGTKYPIVDEDIKSRQRYLDLMANKKSRNIAITRSRILHEIRQFMHGRGFIEVETSMFPKVAGGALARPFTTQSNALSRELLLRISLELPLKKLLVGDLPPVFEIGKVFRNENVDRDHSPEFTMLESYEPYTDYVGVADMVEAMHSHLINTVFESSEIQLPEILHPETNHVIKDARTIQLAPPFEKIKYRDLMYRYADNFDDREHETLAELIARALELGVHVDKTMSRGKILDRIFSEKVEPLLIQPTFVMDYPVESTPLAKRVPNDPTLVERFEFFIDGREIANAYSELNDPVEQRSRMTNEENSAPTDDEIPPTDEDFLIAIDHGMPPAGGIGIGIDRLVMICTAASNLREIILFPTLREPGK